MPKQLLLMRAGIIDPTKVERVALQHAASIAALMAPHPCRRTLSSEL